MPLPTAKAQGISPVEVQDIAMTDIDAGAGSTKRTLEEEGDEASPSSKKRQKV